MNLGRLMPVLVWCGMQMSGAQGQDHLAHRMQIDAGGAVMHENHASLPRGCSGVRAEHEITVVAATKYAAEMPGQIFGMNQTSISVEPCSRVVLTFVNEDEVRHQWMVHGLPRYLYPAGMFHIEAEGGQARTASFIVPAEHQTYLIHCDMAQHMEKGMRGQLIVGSGSGDLWQVPGVSDPLLRDDYGSGVFRWPVDIIAIFLGSLLGLLVWRHSRG